MSTVETRLHEVLALHFRRSCLLRTSDWFTRIASSQTLSDSVKPKRLSDSDKPKSLSDSVKAANETLTSKDPDYDFQIAVNVSWLLRLFAKRKRFLLMPTFVTYPLKLSVECDSCCDELLGNLIVFQFKSHVGFHQLLVFSLNKNQN